MSPCLISRIHCRSRVFCFPPSSYLWLFHSQQAAGLFCRVPSAPPLQRNPCLLVSVSQQVEGANGSPKSQSYVN